MNRRRRRPRPRQTICSTAGSDPMRLRSAAPLLVVSLLLVPVRARADNSAAAEALFEDGRRLMTEGRYDEACSKLEESQRLDPGLGTQFHLANCWQRSGRTASAWALFRAEASEAGPRGLSGRERVARVRTLALGGWLSKLQIAPVAAA